MASLRTRYALARYDLWQFRESGLAHLIARHLPRKVILWAFIRVMAHAWAENGHIHPNEISYEEAYKRWEKPQK